MKKLLILTVLFFGFKICYAQPGKALLTAQQVLSQPDGSMYIIIVSDNRTIIAKKKADGSADLTYGTNAGLSESVPLPYFAQAVLQTDGKIVLAGSVFHLDSTDFALARLNVDGRLDNTFGKNGVQITDFGRRDEVRGLTIQTDGKIIVAGTVKDRDVPLKCTIARYNHDGNLDTTFNSIGVVFRQIGKEGGYNSVTVQTDGKIIVNAGVGIIRYNSNGSPDSTFNKTGIRYYDKYFTNNAITFQPDGKIILTGYYEDLQTIDFMVQRLNYDGSLDSSFGKDGTVLTDFGETSDWAAQSFIEPGGKILTQGFTENDNGIAIALYNPGGTLDKTFANNGKQIMDLENSIIQYSVVKQLDGKWIAAGTAQNFLSFEVRRYNADGTPDSTFDKDGIAIYSLEENKAPSVKLTNPANNAAYFAPATITLKASASDPDGTIKRVQFYNGSTLLFTDSKYPYACAIKNLAAGHYLFVAKATDNGGLISNSATVAVSVSVPPNKAPLVNITSPLNNATFTAPGKITLKANASDPDGTIVNVKFYNGSTFLKTVSKSPYNFTLSNVGPGTYKFYAKATDNKGLSNSSASVYVVVTANIKGLARLSTFLSGQSTGQSLRLAPNPARDIVNIVTAGIEPSQKQTISIISSSGAVMKTFQSSSKDIPINISSLASGVYIVKLISGDKVMCRQLVKF